MSSLLQTTWFCCPQLFRKIQRSGQEIHHWYIHKHTIEHTKNIKMEGAESADGLAGVGIIIEGVEVLHDLDNIANVLAICLASCTHRT